MRICFICCTALALTGCATLSDPREASWQALNVIDALQTDTLRDDPCLKEGHPLTRELIGENPSRGKVIAWAAGGAALHLGVSHWLLDRGYTRTARVWQYISLTDKGIAVVKGYREGVRIGSPNVSCERQGRA